MPHAYTEDQLVEQPAVRLLATPAYQATKGGQTTVRVRVIDGKQPANNDFLLVGPFSATGARWK